MYIARLISRRVISVRRRKETTGKARATSRRRSCRRMSGRRGASWLRLFSAFSCRSLGVLWFDWLWSRSRWLKKKLARARLRLSTQTARLGGHAPPEIRLPPPPFFDRDAERELFPFNFQPPFKECLVYLLGSLVCRRQIKTENQSCAWNAILESSRKSWCLKEEIELVGFGSFFSLW